MQISIYWLHSNDNCFDAHELGQMGLNVVIILEAFLIEFQYHCVDSAVSFHLQRGKAFGRFYTENGWALSVFIQICRNPFGLSVHGWKQLSLDCTNYIQNTKYDSVG